MIKRIRAGVIGASGYTGAELLRLLIGHPSVDVIVATSRKAVGQAVGSYFPNLADVCSLSFAQPNDESLFSCDVIFFATPHGVCMQQVADFLQRGIRVIDFSGDFRLKDASLFKHWYGLDHCAPEALAESVYGLPELFRHELATARLVANPGCYPTAVQLGLAPLFRSGAVQGDAVIADVKSGISGAGREAKVSNLLAEMDGNFKAYAASGHRHQPEIEQGLTYLAGRQVHCTFVPHLLPIIRGIEATLYVPVEKGLDVRALFETMYADEPFVRVLADSSHPETRFVRGTNMVHIGLHHSVDGRLAIISVVEDNLVKGASGQAVQSMNAMFGLPETTGLLQMALLP